MATDLALPVIPEADRESLLAMRRGKPLKPEHSRLYFEFAKRHDVCMPGRLELGLLCIIDMLADGVLIRGIDCPACDDDSFIVPTNVALENGGYDDASGISPHDAAAFAAHAATAVDDEDDDIVDDPTDRDVDDKGPPPLPLEGPTNWSTIEALTPVEVEVEAGGEIKDGLFLGYVAEFGLLKVSVDDVEHEVETDQVYLKV